MDNLTLKSGNDNLLELFFYVDDLVKVIKKNHKVGRKPTLCLSEIMVISIIKSQYGIRTWKQLYELIRDRFDTEFVIPTYKNFVCQMNQSSKAILLLMNIIMYLNYLKSGVIKIMDSTAIPVCKNLRIWRHKVCKSIASKSKTTTGWFYGLKLHILSDVNGNILMIKFSTGKTDDRVALSRIFEQIHDSLVLAGAGYLSKHLEKKALLNNNFLLTCGRKNQKKIATILHIVLLNLRPRIESIFSVLKERLNLITSLPRSVNGYMSHYIHVIFGYLFVKVIS
jgi:hypothetical protein